MELMGVPAEAITLQTRSQNTREDAVYSAEILKQWGVGEIVLVTSATHMPRSLALFRQQGLTVIPAPADFSITEQNWHDLWHPGFGDVLVHLLPNAGDLNSTGTSLKEYIGSAGLRSARLVVGVCDGFGACGFKVPLWPGRDLGRALSVNCFAFSLAREKTFAKIIKVL